MRILVKFVFVLSLLANYQSSFACGEYNRLSAKLS